MLVTFVSYLSCVYSRKVSFIIKFVIQSQKLLRVIYSIFSFCPHSAFSKEVYSAPNLQFVHKQLTHHSFLNRDRNVSLPFQQLLNERLSVSISVAVGGGCQASISK